MRRYLSDAPGNALDDDVYNEREITNWIASVSNQIEKYCDRTFKIESHTEYFDTKYNQVKFWVKSPLITAITSVKEDTDGQWDGSESTYDSTEYYIGYDSSHVVIDEPVGQSYKGLQIVYTGGLAYHGTRTVLTITGSTGTWTAGQFVLGSTSGALGIVRASTATTLTVEVLFGVFEAETVTEYTDEAHATTGDASATVSAVSQQSLAESYPDIVRACEIQVRYYWKHKDSFELTSTQKDGTSYRRGGDLSRQFIDEAMRLLEPYKRIVLI